MDIILSKFQWKQSRRRFPIKRVSLEGTFARIDIKFIGTIIDKRASQD
jgi:hypothetical protein